MYNFRILKMSLLKTALKSRMMWGMTALLVGTQGAWIYCQYAFGWVGKR